MTKQQSRLKKNISGTAKPKKSKGIDLDLILKERGLDIFYMEKVINQYNEQMTSKNFTQKKSGGKSRFSSFRAKDRSSMKFSN